jgi:hypothetical protein
MRPRPGLFHFAQARIDWRGWIALAWVLWWAWAYALMALPARGPQVLAWLGSWTTGR